MLNLHFHVAHPDAGTRVFQNGRYSARGFLLIAKKLEALGFSFTNRYSLARCRSDQRRGSWQVSAISFSHIDGIAQTGGVKWLTQLLLGIHADAARLLSPTDYGVVSILPRLVTIASKLGSHCGSHAPRPVAGNNWLN